MCSNDSYEASLPLTGQPSSEMSEKVGSEVNESTEEPIKMAIVGADTIVPNFSRDFCKKIREAIIDAIEVIEDDPIPLFDKFQKADNPKNHLSVVCVNEYSKRWLIDAVMRLSPFEGRSLVAVEEETVPEFHIVYVYVRYFKIRTGNDILTRIKSSAPSLKTEVWKIRIIKDRDEGSMAKLQIDSFSMGLIEELKYSVHFGMGRAYFWDGKNRKGHDDAEFVWRCISYES